uniref:Amino acid transporter transmembrane domain-containing protein n=1 Tax=Ditylenchus dipsaci TaxID=166011 RepID=A0A915DZX6_9BILA
MATTSAVMLGKAGRFPDYRTHCRKPYAEIGYKALGSNMKTCVSICVNFTQFGASTVFLLLTSKNMDDFLHAFYGMDVVSTRFLASSCWCMISTAIAVALIGTGALLDYSTCAPSRQMPEIKTSNALMAMGTILFTFGGHSAFPTIQHDMKRPNQFGKSAVLAFIIITALNLTAVILGGWTYGNSLRESVINSIQPFAIQQAVNFMITAHCCLTVILIINPLHQEAEEFFHIHKVLA